MPQPRQHDHNRKYIRKIFYMLHVRLPKLLLFSKGLQNSASLPLVDDKHYLIYVSAG